MSWTGVSNERLLVSCTDSFVGYNAPLEDPVEREDIM